MSFFFKLSKYIVVPILKHWLEPSDFGHLDDATTNVSDRVILFNHTSYMKDVLIPHPIPFSVSILSWILSRNFIISELGTLLIKEPDFRMANKYSISVLQPFFDQVVSLDISSFEQGSSILSEFFSVFSELREIKLQCAAILNNELILSKLSKLTALDMSRSELITDKIMDLVLQHCTNLEDIRVPCGNLLTDTFLLSIVRLGKNVNKLAIDNCGKITEEGLLYFIKNHNCKIVSFSYHVMNDTTLLTFMEHLGGEQLQHLDISHSLLLTDICISKVGQFCPNITSLNLSYLRNILDSTMESILKSLKDLRVLKLEECAFVHDGTLRLIALYCFNISALYLKNNNNIVSGLLLLRDCTSLSTLSVEGISLNSNILKSILSACTSIKVLNVSNTGIRDDAFNNNTLISKLVNLQLSHSYISDTGATNIANNCPHLTELNISKSQGNLIPPGVIDIVKKCKKLRVLNVSECSYLNGQFLFAIPVTSKLRSINVRLCPRIHHESLVLMLNRVKSIKCVVTDRNLRYLRSSIDPSSDVIFVDKE